MVAAMLLFALALAAQLAEPPSSPEKGGGAIKLLVMDLAGEDGVDAGTLSTLTGIISAELADYRAIDVMANADVRRMLELEGQKQSVGCGDASCLAEIAGAMGARLVVFGSAGKLGETLVVHLNLYDSVKAQSVGRQFVEAKDVAALPGLLRPKLRALLTRVYEEEGLALPPAPVEATTPEPPKKEPSGPPIAGMLTTGIGAVAVVAGSAALIAGALPWFNYQGHLTTFNEAKSAGDAATAAVERKDAEADAKAWDSYGKASTIGGAVALGAGVVAVGIGATLLLVSGDE